MVATGINKEGVSLWYG